MEAAGCQRRRRPDPGGVVRRRPAPPGPRAPPRRPSARR
ncbi:peptidylprolyl isomerase [Pseudoxanthomonas sp. SGNA-20]|nr:peptidylprolyl isomerase [Pseudoxanthomonas sp. SGNA-20]RRN78994.1 peptidylprolyl isomerase [Pseudoxanthomonas sp. SGD-10]